MKSYPLQSLSLEQAKEKQFALIESITKYFHNNDMLSMGDVGLAPERARARHVVLVEQVLADFFNAQACTLVRNAGTGALQNALACALSKDNKILLHDAPIYPTTEHSLKSMRANICYADFNNIEETLKACERHNITNVLIQITRQKLADSYDSEELIQSLKENFTNIKIITDDNYTVMKVAKIGVQAGADLSCFSMFKLLGTEGIGCILGSSADIEAIESKNYSGGTKVQGFEAMECLRGLVYAPVMLAIQAEEINQLAHSLNLGVVPEIESAFIANAQSKVVITKLKKPIAKEIITRAPKFGAVNYPVGAESKYEIVPMIYKVSGTFIKDNPEMEDYYLRINPMRSSHKIIVKILQSIISDISL